MAYSPPSAIIPSLSPGQPASTGENQRAHKYSNSESSTSSVASSTNTSHQTQSQSHSRNPSYSTNPSTPPSANSITGSFPPLCTFDNFNNNNNNSYYRSAAMADPVDPREDRPNRVAMHKADCDIRLRGSDQRLPHRRAVDITEDDRAESPTDVAMPMMRRAPAGQSHTNR